HLVEMFARGNEGQEPAYFLKGRPAPERFWEFLVQKSLDLRFIRLEYISVLEALKDPFQGFDSGFAWGLGKSECRFQVGPGQGRSELALVQDDLIRQVRRH